MIRQSDTQPFAKRLAEAITNWSDKRLEPYRKRRLKMLRAFGGPWFALNSDEEANSGDYGPINLTHSLVSIMLPVLYLRPRAMLTAKVDPTLSPFCARTEAALDFLAGEDDFDETARMALLEALFGRAVVWTGLGTVEREAGAYLYDPGRVCTRLMREEDIIEDTAARARDEMQFMGHRYCMPFEAAADSGLFDTADLESIRVDYAEESRGMAASGERTQRLYDEVELADIWLPQQGVIVTLPGRMERCTGKFLREDEYIGPETGQYDELSFMTMPGTTLPVSTVANVRDMANIANELFVKLRDRMMAMRDVVIAKPGHEKTAHAVLAGNDNAVITGDPDSIKQVSFASDISRLQAAMGDVLELYNRQAGNPNQLGGLDSSAPTATQEQLLFNSSQVVVSDKRSRNLRFIKSVMRKRAWYLWYGPGPLNLKLSLDVPGVGALPVEWSRDDAEADLSDLMIDIQPYGATDDSPEATYNRLMQWLSQVVLPLSGIATEQGYRPDVGLIAQMTGRQLRIPDAAAIFRPAPPQQAPEMAVSVDGGDTTVNAGGRVPGPRPDNQPHPSEVPAGAM